MVNTGRLRWMGPLLMRSSTLFCDADVDAPEGDFLLDLWRKRFCSAGRRSATAYLEAESCLLVEQAPSGPAISRVRFVAAVDGRLLAAHQTRVSSTCGPRWGAVAPGLSSGFTPDLFDGSQHGERR